MQHLTAIYARSPKPLSLLIRLFTWAHRPQVYAMVQGVKQYVTTFSAVSKAGDYLAQVPRQYSELLIDNYYGVIA